MFLKNLILGLLILKGEPRIISLAPSITDFLIKFGAQNYIVGKTYYCNKSVEAEIILNPSMRISREKILKLRPDYALSAGIVSEEDIDFLKRRGIKVVDIKYKNLLDIAESFLIIGKILKKEEKALYLLKLFLDSLFIFKDIKKGTKLLYVLDLQGGIWTCGKNTFISHYLNWMGFKNIGDIFEGYKVISPEIIFEKKPDIVIFAFEKPERLFKGTPLEKISAIKNNKYYIVPDPDYFSRPSPYILKALKFLSSID
jgi:iron complex transport system substrate-binding protein